jgi:hypothetical protein
VSVDVSDPISEVPAHFETGGFHCGILLPDPVNKVFVTHSSGFQSDTSLPKFKPGIASISGLRAASLKKRFRELEGCEHFVDRVVNTLLTGL